MTDEELSTHFVKLMHEMANRTGGGLRDYFKFALGRAGQSNYVYRLKEISKWEEGYGGEQTFQLRFSMVPNLDPYLPPRGPEYDYESTAEEIVDLPAPRKELPHGND